MIGPSELSGTAVSILILGLFLSAGQQPGTVQEVELCGPRQAKHTVIKHKEKFTPKPAEGKSLIYFYWTGIRFRSWAAVRTKLAVDGEYVAVLKKNTYAVVEAEPGLQKLCVSGKGKKSSIHSLLFLTTEPGKTYFLEGSPGGDSLWGEGKPKVVLVSDEKGLAARGESR